ncbi:MAG: heparinase II/III family protein [Bradyrhizobiaceae bacterium]|nr:heparinase II/III family protein [Bradyrhizobiaceae bacterium]
MSREGLAERLRLARFVAGHGWRKLMAGVTANPRIRWRVGLSVPERLLIAPQDLRTADPTLASEFYAGRFVFAGKVVATDGRSPFEMPPPSREWEETLLGFGWLRHLRAAGTSIAQANARALVADWIAMQGASHPVAWQPEIVARRVISWLTQAPLILEGADHKFYHAFLKSLARQVRYLRRTLGDTRDGYPRLLVTIALTFAGLCMQGETRLLKASARRLAQELNRQILPDGGHISRNPGVLIELLIDLLPLRQSFEARSVPPPSALLNAIDRMMPMLRFFRHRDGAFAQFNGMGATPSDLLATALAYDDARGAPVANAPHSGYQRVECGESIIIIDTGAPPPLLLSHEAHAGCLSFEFSNGRNRIVINCGMPAANRDAWRPAARATAAHSTVTLNEASSCRFLTNPTYNRLIGVPIVEGPVEVRATRGEREGAQLIRASHDGYASRFGLLHQRSWRLSADGTRLDGEDVFFTLDGEPAPADAPDTFVIRFHLHPNVKASRRTDGSSVLLVLPGKESWLFSAPNMEVEVEESVFLSATDGPRRTSQIIIADEVRALPRIVWTFIRAPQGTREKEREQAETAGPKLPL